MTVLLSGISICRGIAIGDAHVTGQGTLEVPQYQVREEEIEAEAARLSSALQRARQQLLAIQDRIPADTPAEVRSFIDTHLLMLADTSLSEGPARLIRTRRMNAEWALKRQREMFVRVFEAMDDPYLRTRRDDVDHVINRVLRVLLQLDHPKPAEPLEGQIVVADDLTPADTVLMHHQGVAGLVTGYGGPLSHTAILARSLGIPAVAGIRQGWQLLRDGDRVVVDGHAGQVLVDPDERTLDQYRHHQQQDQRQRNALAKLRKQPAISADGQAVSLQANIELPEDLNTAQRNGATGVGLYRTEFLFMNREDIPDEEEQLEVYRATLARLGGMPLTIRTLDLGADKGNPEASAGSGNPALGLRAVRLCLQDQELFLPQLRAILRASAEGPIRMMVPMLSNLQEVQQVRQLVEETKRALRCEGLCYDEAMPVGGMIEVPSAALCAPSFARHLDFLSIGTNDLIQYTLAIDRVDDTVNYLYNPLHPAVLRLIHTILQGGRRAGVPVSMCGEMAGDVRYARLLLGLGLSEFSMHPSSLLDVKRVIKDTAIAPLAAAARRVLRCDNPEEIVEQVDALNQGLNNLRLAQ